MSITRRFSNWLGLRSAETGTMPESIAPPTRGTSLAAVTAERALTLGTVFRAAQVLSTSVAQMSVKVQRGGTTIDAPTLIKTPSLSMERPAFLEEVVTSLALAGNCYWRLVRADGPASPVIDIQILPANEVRVAADPRTLELTYWHKGTGYRPADIRHLKYLRIPGKIYGLGPIQAAQRELAGTLDARDYAAGWFSESDEPTGILTSDQDLTTEKAQRYRDAFKRTGDYAPKDGDKRRDIRVLGAGLRYESLLLKPADVQFLESQQFSTTQIARLFGIVSSIMLAAAEGKSQTYANVEQDWIAFVRFTLMKYLLEIESAFSSLLPYGSRAKFSPDALLRTDTKTRYEAHNLALTGGWKVADEIRDIEDLPPFTDAQRAEAATRRTAPAPTPEGVSK